VSSRNNTLAVVLSIVGNLIISVVASVLRPRKVGQPPNKFNIEATDQQPWQRMLCVNISATKFEIIHF